MNKLLLSIGVAAVFSSCAVQQTVPSKVDVQDVTTMSNAAGNVLLYSLPTTVVRVNVEVEKTISRVGPFYRYSQKMLNISDVVTENKEEWRIKSINIETYGKPNPDRQYAISFTGQCAAPFVNLTPSGILAGINNESSVSASYLKDFTQPVIPTINDVNFNDVPMIEKQMVKTSTAAMAEETANYIYKIRKRRFKILASDYEQLPPDGQSYEVMVRELNKLEKQHMELFVGKTETFTITKSFDIVPDKMSTSNDVLFRFSTVKGIVDKMDVSGSPVYFELDTQDFKNLQGSANVIDKKQDVRNGLFYIKPGKGLVKIIDKNVLVKEKEVYLSQYGQVVSMPANVLERDDVRIRIDSATGALQSIDKKQ
ncbi:DUF4831 family protein [Carboxylicivirga taeanensis]|uniref:DUF4831 family protein n=1 Tax=Carboxylicivirga taeanensis TaxID=1416875 RepID=UPI003F6DE8E3